MRPRGLCFLERSTLLLMTLGLLLSWLTPRLTRKKTRTHSLDLLLLTNRQSGCIFSASIPNGATINSASIQIYGSLTGSSINQDIFCHASDNSSDFASDSAIWGRSRTSSSSRWNGAWSLNSWNISPDFSSVVQEVTDRAGWASGNNLCVLIIAPTQNGANTSIGASYDINSTNAPKLDIDYTEGAGSSVTPDSVSLTLSVPAPTLSGLTNQGYPGKVLVKSSELHYCSIASKQTIGLAIDLSQKHSVSISDCCKGVS